MVKVLSFGLMQNMLMLVLSSYCTSLLTNCARAYVCYVQININYFVSFLGQPAYSFDAFSVSCRESSRDLQVTITCDWWVALAFARHEKLLSLAYIC